jgi:hypothetical protein
MYAFSNVRSYETEEERQAKLVETLQDWYNTAAECIEHNFNIVDLFNELYTGEPEDLPMQLPKSVKDKLSGTLNEYLVLRGFYDDWWTAKIHADLTPKEWQKVERNFREGKPMPVYDYQNKYLGEKGEKDTDEYARAKGTQPKHDWQMTFAEYAAIATCQTYLNAL